MADETSRRISIDRPHVLLVEGPDDRVFFEALAGKLLLHHPIQIIELRGRNNLRARLDAVVTISRVGIGRLRSIGVALDCEENPGAAAQMIRDAFGAANLAVPANALDAHENDPRVAYMLFPDDHTPGMLEDLCLRAFARDPAFSCVDRFFGCLDQQNAFFSKADASKASVRAYLSSKEKAETRLGIAAQKSWWPWDDPAFDEAKQFLRLITGS